MMSTNPKLIRLVTARYHEMQGLATMFGAGFPLLQGSIRFIPDSEWSTWLLGACALVVCVYLYLHFSLIGRRIPGYYANRFGRIGGYGFFSRQSLGLWLSMAIGYNNIFRDAFHMPMAWRSVVMLFMLCSYPTWVAVRDFPYRGYWALLTFVGAYTALEIPAFAAREFLPIWSRNANLAIGAALMIVGACDHLLLAHTLRGGTQETDVSEHVQL